MYVFRVTLSNSGTSDFVVRWCVLEIQDRSQITGSTNNFAGFTDTHVVLKTILGFMTMYTKHPNVQQSWPTQPRVENPRWQPTNRK